MAERCDIITRRRVPRAKDNCGCKSIICRDGFWQFSLSGDPLTWDDSFYLVGDPGLTINGEYTTTPVPVLDLVSGVKLQDWSVAHHCADRSDTSCFGNALALQVASRINEATGYFEINIQSWAFNPVSNWWDPDISGDPIIHQERLIIYDVSGDPVTLVSDTITVDNSATYGGYDLSGITVSSLPEFDASMEVDLQLEDSYEAWRYCVSEDGNDITERRVSGSTTGVFKVRPQYDNAEAPANVVNLRNSQMIAPKYSTIYFSLQYELIFNENTNCERIYRPECYNPNAGAGIYAQSIADCDERPGLVGVTLSGIAAGTADYFPPAGGGPISTSDIDVSGTYLLNEADQILSPVLVFAFPHTTGPGTGGNDFHYRLELWIDAKNTFFNWRAELVHAFQSTTSGTPPDPNNWSSAGGFSEWRGNITPGDIPPYYYHEYRELYPMTNVVSGDHTALWDLSGITGVEAYQVS